MSGTLRISVLTAALNARKGLEDCLRSVASQKLPVGTSVEHLVLDGGSTDGSLEHLRQWAAEDPAGRRFVSGSDAGFYDALNRGLELAGGEVIALLNADDSFYDDHSLARVAQVMGGGSAQGCYGDLVYVGDGSRASDAKVVRYWKSGEYGPRSFHWGWMPPHPTVCVRKRVYEQCGGFRLDLGSAADYEWMVRVMVKHGVRLEYIPRIQTAMRVGGMSNRDVNARVRANRNDAKAWAVNGLRPLPWTLLVKPLRKIPQWFSGVPR